MAATQPSHEIRINIHSNASRLDYAPNDPARWQEIMQVGVATLRIANAICAAIDQYL
jgi:hypothetical protein